MNDWYIDRSKNFINGTFEPVISFFYRYSDVRDSRTIINKLISNCIFDEDSGNPNAALTRFRDHGIINNSNVLGEPAIDYVEKRITRDELIIDLMLKRPALKKGSANLKPLVLLCKFFDVMYEIAVDEAEVFLTYEECFNYLYHCNTLQDISTDFVDSVMENRLYDTARPEMKQNDYTNLSIWFNALCNTPIFLQTNERSIVRPNPYAKPFIKFIAINGPMISETPTTSNTELYNYYCSRAKGLSEIIPSVFLPNVISKNRNESEVLYKYVFGIKREPDFAYSSFFENECFGVYNPFLFIPGLAIRKIWINNKPLGASLYELTRQKID